MRKDFGPQTWVYPMPVLIIGTYNENGEPNAAYFRTDGLHLSYYGYVVWGGIIKESIVKGLENN